MKKMMIMLMFLTLVFTTVNAHNVDPLCWWQGYYSFKATQLPSGTATVKVYSSSNYTHLIYDTTLSISGGQIVYPIRQPDRTTKVYVKVTWSDNYINKDPTGINECVSTPIVFGNISAKNIGENTIITFEMLYTEDVRNMSLTFKLQDGVIKEYPINFPFTVHYGEIWEIIFNNITKKYTIKKK